MAAELPSEVDCRGLLAAGGKLSGTLQPDRITRLADEFRAGGVLRASLQLDAGRSGTYRLTGQLVAPLEARCQRCLAWMPLELESEFECLLVDSGASAGQHGNEQADEDIIEIHDGVLAVAALVEDEVLLSCPMIPQHLAGDCDGEAKPAPADLERDRHRPFAALGDMLKAAEGDNNSD